ncbi:glycosyltransferase family 2 protein [Paraburkholderia sp. HD33-4]|uniref:glycosyltransferase family 2 protein n=1 Tax=Paraburkholderia sp. HD33-4 TaxID=2883242 RepID=UPI001F410BFB|nr:glycosyltransferase family 2 protein [Paraburkholderia sp. HD33-4]
MSNPSSSALARAPVAHVSICVPTCNRPDLLVECVDSCLAQSYRQVEIVIGDDSTDARTRQLILQRYRDEPRVRYERHEPPLGQARNVSSLFARARGDKILLIHDDDLLTSDAVDQLVSLWQRYPQLDAAFGAQYEADHDGAIDFGASLRLNAAFRRTKASEGLQPLAGRTGLIQMFPNNGWMADARLVKRIGYDERYGVCCDYVFGTQLCLAAREVFYLHDYVSVYRKTATSISHSTRGTGMAATLSAYAFVKSLRLPARLEASRRQALRRFVPIVVSIHAKNGDARTGWRIARTHLFAYKYGFSARLYYHLLMLARAAWRGRLPMASAAAEAVAGVAAAPSMATVGAVGAVAVNEAARSDEFVGDRSRPV